MITQSFWNWRKSCEELFSSTIDIIRSSFYFTILISLNETNNYECLIKMLQILITISTNKKIKIENKINVYIEIVEDCGLDRTR